MALRTHSAAITGAAVAAVLVIAGGVVWLTAPGGSASFGWFAYAPLADDAFSLPLVLFGQQIVAVGLVVVGLITAGVAAGFSWGRRVARIDAPRGSSSHPEIQ